MKRVVESSKQTVWVLTMLTVMVVLSVYYLVSEPLVNENVMENKEDITADISTGEVEINDLATEMNLMDGIGVNTNDLLIGLKMERTNNRAKQIDQLYDMMSSNLSEEAIAAIQGKIERLQTIEESEFVLEKLILADGYNDAVVLTNGNSVDVIIQIETMTKAEAVKIIKMVSERLNIPAVNVHIKTVN